MKKIAIVCDFDGTVAGEDVGNLLFRTFAGEEKAGEVVSMWKRGEISSRQCLEKECAMARVSKQDLDDFIQKRSIDVYFKDFLDFTRKRGVEIVILSDGLDYYIEKMLIRNGLGEVEFFANRMKMTDHSIKVEFPYFDLMDCEDCGNCKLHHLERYRKDGYYIVYIGDGLSDKCPAEHADLVFAKGDLLDYCRDKGIKHLEFKNFRDVEREMLRNLALSDPDMDEFADN